MELNLIDIYDQFLKEKDEAEADQHGKSGMYYASQTGGCIKKTLMTQAGIKGGDIDARTRRVFRLGELVHEDIQLAVESIVEPTDDLVVWIEEEFTIPKYNVKCKIDVGFWDKVNKSIAIHDIKTVHSYKWKMMFGRKKDAKASTNYELQLGSYGMAIREKVKDVNQSYYLTWYKKDDSSMKEIQIAPEWEEMAEEYWKDVKTSPKYTQISRNSLNSPVSDWECRYCKFESICK